MKQNLRSVRSVNLSPALFVIISLALGSLRPNEAHALGFRIPNQDAEATGRGNAFTATADNPSAIYYNPAGITQLEGTRALLGAYAISLEAKVDLDAPGGNNHFASTNDELQFAPQLYLTYKPKSSRVAIGL